jgi:hypothetical protein
MEEEDIDQLYSTIADLAVSLSMEHSALKIAAVLNAVSMSIYKTALSESDYEKMCETIFDLRNDVHTFNPVWEEQGGTVH